MQKNWIKIMIFFSSSLLLAMGIVPGNNIITDRYPTQFNANNSTVIFYPIADTHLNHRQPDGNWGSDVQLEARNEYGSGGSSGWAWDSLLKFNLSSFSPFSKIVSAQLKIYYYQWDSTNPQGRSIRVYRATSDWVENLVTWNTQPSYALQITSSTDVPSSYGWMSWNVTTDVQDFISQEQINFGWKLTDEAYWGLGGIPETRWYSREYTNPNYRPYLEIKIKVIANAGGPYYGNQGSPVHLSGSADYGNSPYTYAWDFDNDGQYIDAIGATPSYIWSTYGIKTIGLNVTDALGEYDTDSATVHINAHPIANFSVNPEIPLVNESILFDASGSYDPDGTISQYQWFFGDGTNDTGMKVNHTFVNCTTFFVNLTVIDYYGVSDTLIRTITIYQNESHIIIMKIMGGFGVSAMIRNNGTAPAMNITWSINASGGLLIRSGDHTEDVIAELAIGASTTIKSKGLRGIGPVITTVQVGDVTKEATAFLLGPLVLGVKEL